MRRADKPTFPAGKGSPDGRIKRRGGRCRLSVLLLFCVLLAGATCPACAGKPVKHTASFYAMDTVISVTLYTPDAELAGQLEARAHAAKLIVSKSSELLTYDEYKQRMAANR